MLTQHILENQCRVVRLFKQQKRQYSEEKNGSGSGNEKELFSLSFMLKTLNLAESLVYERVCFNAPCWFTTPFPKNKPDLDANSNQSAPLSSQPKQE